MYALRDRRDFVAMLGSDRTWSTERASGGRLGLGAEQIRSARVRGQAAARGTAGAEVWPHVGPAHAQCFTAGLQSLDQWGRVVADDE